MAPSSSSDKRVIRGLEMRSHSHKGRIDYGDLAPVIDDVAKWRKFRETKLAKQGPARGLMAQPATRPPPRYDSPPSFFKQLPSRVHVNALPLCGSWSEPLAEDDSWGINSTEESVVWGSASLALARHSAVGVGSESPSQSMAYGNGKGASHAFLSPIQRSRKPGFSFLKGKKPPSALDIVTGTTDSDKCFRRVQLSDGSVVIVPVTGDTRLPNGAYFLPSWGQTHTTGTQLDLDVKLLTSPGECSSYNGRRYHEEETRGGNIHSLSLPSASRGRPVTAAEPPRPPIKYIRKDDAFYLQIKSVESERLGSEGMNNLPPGTAGIGVKVSDKFPVVTPFFRPISVRNHRSGAGDTAGLSRLKSPLDISMQLQTILTHDFGRDVTDEL